MPLGIDILITAIITGGIGLAIGWLLGRSRSGMQDLSKPLNDLEQKLSSEFQKANVDMAERVERMKGALLQDLSGQILQGLNTVRETVERQLADGRNEQAQRLAEVVKSLEQKFEVLKSATESKLEKSSEQQTVVMKDLGKELTTALGRLVEETDKKLNELKVAVEAKLSQIQSDNAVKLEEMRKTVDEKLQGTLDKRLGESFKIVSERLELVHKGLGEMHSLATGVGDLKRVLTNVKTRGTWGEMQLGNLLEQILTPEQYAPNVPTKKGSLERVEFAIKLPGRDAQDGKTVWLPIDAKFPKEDYERLVEAAERADAEGVEQAAKQLEVRIKSEAADIHDKYIDPPNTTDFGVLFLPTEGLYAEVLRRPGLAESLQRDFRVVVAGPTTLAALLNSLQMGFQTLAIEKRSSEVWRVLGAVKTEFSKFGGVIEKVRKKLQEAGNVIDTAAVRSRAIERNLRDVAELPAEEAAEVLGEVMTSEGESDLPNEAPEK